MVENAASREPDLRELTSAPLIVRPSSAQNSWLWRPRACRPPGAAMVLENIYSASSQPRPSGVPAPPVEPNSPGPRFSVVVPAFNESAYLGACLQSLAAQDFAGGFEVIVVDNNSTDGTAHIARHYGAHVVEELTAGVCWARQTGTLAARGEIVVSTDADTVYDPGWLSRIETTFGRHPGCVAVSGPCRFRDAPAWGRLYTFILFRLVSIISRISSRVVYATATNIAFRRSAFTGYDTNASQGGDELGLLRALRRHGLIVFDFANPCLTSSRRLRRGLAYNLVVTCLYYYVLGYCLSRVFRRPVIGNAPAFRKEQVRPTPARRALRVLIAVGCITAILFNGEALTYVASAL